MPPSPDSSVTTRLGISPGISHCLSGTGRCLLAFGRQSCVALRWADVDFNRNVLHVRQRVDFKNVAGPPKSSAGERRVPLTPRVLAALREHKGAPPDESDLVFPTGNGKAQYHGNIVKRGLIPTWVAAGVTAPAR